MKYIISGTDRLGSNSLKVAKYIQNIYKQLDEAVEIIDLQEIKGLLAAQSVYSAPTAELKVYLDKVTQSDGLIVVCPEYNGSMPGILKYFIDHLKFPEAFEYRPVCFVGLGFMFGGLRPVEHLQGVFGYRNAFIFPERVFITQPPSRISESGDITDEMVKKLLETQAKGFQKFCTALAEYKLSANTFKNI